MKGVVNVKGWEDEQGQDWGGGEAIVIAIYFPEHRIFRFANFLYGTTDTDMLVVKHIYIYTQYDRLTSF